MKNTLRLPTPTFMTVCLLVHGGAGCTLENLASFGGDQAGARGEIQVIFINNTPFSVVFTFGTYDDADPTSAPDFAQFGASDESQRLGADSEFGPIDLTCARVLSLGSPALLENIRNNRPESEIDSTAFHEGIRFVNANDPESLEGQTVPFEARIGRDFPCSALVVIYLEHDETATEPFRVDFAVLPSSSSR